MTHEEARAGARKLALELIPHNPGRRFAISSNGCAVAVFDETANEFVSQFEQTLFGKFISGGLNIAGRVWEEIAPEAIAQ